MNVKKPELGEQLRDPTVLQCNPSGRCWLSATAARASSTSREHITTRKIIQSSKTKRRELTCGVRSSQGGQAQPIREQDGCSHTVFSEEPQFSSTRCRAAPTTAAKYLLFPCTQHLYATDANGAENTQVSLSRVTSAVCFL